MSDHPAMQVQHSQSLKTLNTFGIDALTRQFVRLADRAQVAPLRAWLKQHGRTCPELVLGGGSNILLTSDVAGLTLQMALKGITIQAAQAESGKPVQVRAAAGENWHEFVDMLIENNIGGLENLSLIPGTVGAAPIQNIGAYGMEVAQHIVSVEVMDWQDGSITELSAQDCRFGYRNSVFKQQPGRWLVLSVLFELAQNWRPVLDYRELAEELGRDHAETGHLTPRLIADAVCAIRRRKLPDPQQIGNAGSFFKNPVVNTLQHDALKQVWPGLVSYPQTDGSFKLAAGWLIDQCGWKGRSLGAAGVHDRQALVLVNRGGATGADIVRLAQTIQNDVQQRFGVALEPEPLWV